MFSHYHLSSAMSSGDSCSFDEKFPLLCLRARLLSRSNPLQNKGPNSTAAKFDTIIPMTSANSWTVNSGLVSMQFLACTIKLLGFLRCRLQKRLQRVKNSNKSKESYHLSWHWNCLVSPCRYWSSLYPTLACPAFLRVAYTGLSILVKQRGAHDRPLGKQVNWNNLPLLENLRKFWCDLCIGTQYYASFRSTVAM